MRSRPRLALLIVLAAILVVAAVVVIGHFTTESSRAKSERAEVDKHAPVLRNPSGLQPVAAPASGWNSQTLGRVADMRAEFNEARDLSAFFYSALKLPQQGGIFYARKAYENCYALRHAVAAAALRASSSASLEAALTRCGQLGSEKTKRQLLDSLRASADEDPVQLAAASLQASVDRQQNAVNVLSQAIAMGDPYLFRAALYRAIDVSRYFDGMELDGTLRRNLVTAATVVQCDLGADCTNEPTVPISCIQEGGCAGSVVTLVLDRPSLPDSQKVAIARLSDKLNAAARDGSLPLLFSGRREG